MRSLSLILCAKYHLAECLEEGNLTMKLIMSLSGIRGIVGETLTPEIALKVGQSIGQLAGQGPVVIGGDTRTSHDTLKSATISGLLSVGCNVIDIGRVTTPTVQQMIKAHSAKAGIVITASHNPEIWNGLKLMNDTGAFFTESEFQTFKTFYDQTTSPCHTWESQGSLTYDAKAIEKHVDLILSKIDISDIKKSKLRVLVDANHGAGSAADPTLLSKLGVAYTILGEKGDGHFSHAPEPTKQNLSTLIQEMKSGNYDIGFAQDADADRLVIVAENGNFIGEDYSLAFCIDHVLSLEKPQTGMVVVNLSTSNVIDYICKKHGVSVLKTKIGEANVTQGMKDHNAIVGGEGNGGVIYPKVGWGRDSLVGIVLALDHLAKTKKSVSEIVESYPKYVMLREKVTVSNSQEIETFIKNAEQKFPGALTNKEDGVKIILENAWVHVRPSNTEPIVRSFIEAPTEVEANALFKQLTGK